MPKEIYLSIRLNGHSITDDIGKSYTIAEAKKTWEENPHMDCNIAFLRLIERDWDMDAVNKYYDENF